MRFGKLLRDNGLTLLLAAITVLTLGGHLVAGYAAADPRPASLAEYAASGEFLSSLFENWESEYLQMMLYVLLTVFLFQRGSSESKDPDEAKPLLGEDPRRHARGRNVPGPVRRGGFALRIYGWSLTTALGLLFAGSFLAHLAATSSSEGQGALRTLRDPEFWFESFQNWQSEFLSITSLVVLSIFLRQRGSPESKPVHFPHSRTGKGEV